MSVCRSCHAPVLWVVTQAGKRMPLDAAPTDAGNVIRYGDAARVLTADEVAARRSPRHVDPGPLYVSHFTSCPNAAQHRKPK